LCTDSVDPDEVIEAVKASVEGIREQRSA
jgi:hypothetical protein